MVRKRKEAGLVEIALRGRWLRFYGNFRQKTVVFPLLTVFVTALVASAAMGAQIYRCHDPRLESTVYQDKPCANEVYSVAQTPVQTQAIAPVSPRVVPQVSDPVAPAVLPKQQQVQPRRIEPVAISVAPVVAPLYKLAGFLFLLSIAGAFLLHRRQKAGSYGVEPVWIPPKTEPGKATQISATQPPKPKDWSLTLLQSIEWKRFEDLCAEYYRATGLRAETNRELGPDGGIDIRLYQAGDERASTIVQCKAWPENKVGIKLIRELLGVRVAENADKAFFMTCGGYTDDAQAFAKANGITLFTGEMFLMMLQRLPEAERQRLLAFATEGDYTTPTCPQCGQKLVARESGRGKFWGCRSYPRCKGKLGMRGA